ncbi:MAG: hypothetical protein ACOC93_01225 [Planctomycetota bacterium]
MFIRLRCKCHTAYSVDESQAGGKIQCIRCGKVLDVPSQPDPQMLRSSPGGPPEPMVQWGAITAAGSLAVSVLLILVLQAFAPDESSSSRLLAAPSSPSEANGPRSPESQTPRNDTDSETSEPDSQAPADPAPPQEKQTADPPDRQPEQTPQRPPDRTEPEPQPAPAEQADRQIAASEAEPAQPVALPNRPLAGQLPAVPGGEASMGPVYIRLSNSNTRDEPEGDLQAPPGQEILFANAILHRQRDVDRPFAGQGIFAVSPTDEAYPLQEAWVRKGMHGWTKLRGSDLQDPLPVHWSASRDEDRPHNRYFFFVPAGSDASKWQIQLYPRSELAEALTSAPPQGAQNPDSPAPDAEQQSPSPPADGSVTEGDPPPQEPAEQIKRRSAGRLQTVAGATLRMGPMVMRLSNSNTDKDRGEIDLDSGQTVLFANAVLYRKQEFPPPFDARSLRLVTHTGKTYPLHTLWVREGMHGWTKLSGEQLSGTLPVHWSEKPDDPRPHNLYFFVVPEDTDHRRCGIQVFPRPEVAELLGAEEPEPPKPPDPEEQARRRLQTAEIYLQNRMNERAEEILRGIIQEYPNTDAAQTARELLR